MHSSEFDRRVFIRRATAATIAILLPRQLIAQAGAGTTGLSIGVVLPDGHPAWPGVRLGAAEAEHAARLFRSDFTIREAPASGAAAARAAAERLVDDGIAFLIGGADVETADALADVARNRAVPLLNIGTAADTVSQRCDRYTFHLVPSTVVRQSALAAVSAAPAARAVLWHSSLTRYGAGQINDRYVEAMKAPMSESAWTGWLAVKIAFDAAQRAATGDGAALAAHLTAERTVFDGHKGAALAFLPGTQELRQPLYIIVDDDVVADVPPARGAGDRSSVEMLDALFADAASCG
jgi:ABC-type branched-subunit amino acid transport system substrate-binding protein